MIKYATRAGKTLGVGRAGSKATVIGRRVAMLFAIAISTCGIGLTVPESQAAAATVYSCAAKPSDQNCDDIFPGGPCMSDHHYVVDSSPLVRQGDGVANWAFGYIQLWWSDNCQTNWARLVVNTTQGNDYLALVQRQNPFDDVGQYYDPGFGNFHGPGAYLSQMAYAPDSKACALGQVSGTGLPLLYEGQTGQFLPCD
jgi:hypothetical protein